MATKDAMLDRQEDSSTMSFDQLPVKQNRITVSPQNRPSHQPDNTHQKAKNLKIN